ncbi:MAG: hypothetical protein WD557_17400 [Dehalococcoidia bacterium]
MAVWIADAHVLAVVAVGSAVRDVPNPSDADFVIIWDGGRPKSGHPPVEIDLRFYECSRAEALIAGGNDYLQWAVRLGEPVHEKRGFWTQFARSWIRAAPWPDPADADKRAERAERYERDLAAAGDQDAAAEQRISGLTHRARGRLLRAGVFPASRPELPMQLKEIGEPILAEELERALGERLA